MAASKRPSFLKRQKEQARLARATEKREARRARKHSKSNAAENQEGDLPESDILDIQDELMSGGEETDKDPL